VYRFVIKNKEKLIQPSQAKILEKSNHGTSMANHTFDNTYHLSNEQLLLLDEAEELMIKGALGKAENILLEMLAADQNCIPVLSNLGHLYGRYLSEFERAVEYYNRVLDLEPDNAGARDARRRYLRDVE